MMKINTKKELSDIISNSISKRIFKGFNGILMCYDPRDSMKYYPFVSVVSRQTVMDIEKYYQKNICLKCSKEYNPGTCNFFTANQTGFNVFQMGNRKSKCLFFNVCYGCLCYILYLRNKMDIDKGIVYFRIRNKNTEQFKQKMRDISSDFLKEMKRKLILNNRGKNESISL